VRGLKGTISVVKAGIINSPTPGILNAAKLIVGGMSYVTA
jgi:hypothetical protein